MNSKLRLKVVLATSMMLITSAYINFIGWSDKVVTNTPLGNFPRKIGTWVGKISHFDKKIYDVLGVDDSILIYYRNDKEEEAQLYVGYYQTQREGDLIHSPKNCMPGSGWAIINSSEENLSIPEYKREKIEVNKLTIKKNAEKQIVLYWFQSRGRIITSEYYQKLYLIWDAIARKRTDGSFVRLMGPVGKNGEKYTTNYLMGLAEEIIPILDKYLPG